MPRCSSPILHAWGCRASEIWELVSFISLDNSGLLYIWIYFPVHYLFSLQFPTLFSLSHFFPLSASISFSLTHIPIHISFAIFYLWKSIPCILYHFEVVKRGWKLHLILCSILERTLIAINHLKREKKTEFIETVAPNLKRGKLSEKIYFEKNSVFKQPAVK